MTLIPSGHEEKYAKKGEIVIRDKEDFSKCKKGEWFAIIEAWNITFNDMFCTWTDKNGGHYEDISSRFITVYSKEERVEEDISQLSIFEFL